MSTMHMADALISPAVGGAMWAATAATTAYCARRVRSNADEGIVPLMGVTGAFVFAAQMVNFSIPGTGSSGHLGGGLLLAVLLGPEAAFLVMASILGVQALFFADGGLLALGANVFNLAFFPAFVALPLVYRPIAGDGSARWRVVLASVLAGVLGLQAGSAGVVLQTALSGVSALPLGPFLAVMQPIHLAIGVVEGLVTAAVLLFVMRAQPGILRRGAGVAADPVVSRRLIAAFAIVAVLVGGGLAYAASADPDGLESSIERVAGAAGLTTGGGAHQAAAQVQERTALLPDYDVPERAAGSAGTGLAGVAGVAVTLAVVMGAGWLLRRRARSAARD